MPAVDNESFQVSKEEERYLRRTFRRFALPYVLVALALAGTWGAVNGFQLGPAHDPGESTEIQGLIAESASLRQAIAGLRGDLDGVAARAEESVARVSSLEKRVAQIADATEAVGAQALRRRLEEAHQRINALDASLAAVTAARANVPTNDPVGRVGNREAIPPASSGTAGEGTWPADAPPY